MAAVQEYPPWLTPSQIVVTDAAGVVATETTVVYLPLTYLGPSIPLGSLYTYGGSTYPPTIVTGYPTTTPTPIPPATSATTTPAIPSITTTIPASSETPTSSLSESSSFSLTDSSSSSLSSTSIPSTVTPLPTSSSSPSETPTTTGFADNKGRLVGVIVSGILLLLFLFVVTLATFLWCKGRRNRRSSQFYSGTPIESEYYFLSPEEQTEARMMAGGSDAATMIEARVAGEGSPRHSGEEIDSLLQPSGSSPPMQQTTAAMVSRSGVSRRPVPVAADESSSPLDGSRNVPRVPVPVMGSISSSGSASEMGTRQDPSLAPVPAGSQSSSGSSGTNISGYGTLLERPTLGILPPTAEYGEFGSNGHHLTAEEMRQLENESVLPRDQEEEYTGAYAISKDPLLPPPRLVDPEHFGQYTDIPRPLPQAQHRARESVGSNPSLGDAEDAALLTARRVKVSEAGSPSLHEASPSVHRSGFLDAIGLSNLTRLSWFGSGDSPKSSPRNSRHSPTFQAVPLFDSDIETGRALLRPATDSLGRLREGTVGLGADGERPNSHLSVTSVSGATIWHDANSSLPATPQLAVLPRAITPADVPHAEQDLLAGQGLPLRSPPPYDDTFAGNSQSQSPSGIDILDLPAPTALTHFASSSSMRDSGTVSSVGLSKHPYPPGLEFVARAKAWDGSASSTSSPAWNSVSHRVNLTEFGDRQSPAAVVDMLEEQPPSAQETWRSLASSNTGGGFGELGRRTTFGLPLYTHPSFIPSEQGSLHSMRSHIDPPSLRSTGSAAASRRDLSGSVSSGSSRPSGHSSSRSAGSATSSINNSLVRAGSIIQEGRRRFDPHTQPPHSPFGNRGFLTPPRAATPADVGLFKHGEVPTIDGSSSTSGPMIPTAHISPDRASTIRTVTSASTAVPGGRERTTSVMTYGAPSSIGEESLPLSTPALSQDWTPTA